jgi:hypothetical protein
MQRTDSLQACCRNVPQRVAIERRVNRVRCVDTKAKGTRGKQWEGDECGVTAHLAKGVLGEEGGGLVLPSGNVHLSGGQGNASVLGRNQGLERAEVTGEGVDGLVGGARGRRGFQARKK